jgi:rRNA maturation endonuclease Nob1
MRCSNCNVELENGAKICANCGAVLKTAAVTDNSDEKNKTKSREIL